MMRKSGILNDEIIEQHEYVVPERVPGGYPPRCIRFYPRLFTEILP